MTAAAFHVEDLFLHRIAPDGGQCMCLRQRRLELGRFLRFAAPVCFHRNWPHLDTNSGPRAS
jgi:hypothetical protein